MADQDLQKAEITSTGKESTLSRPEGVPDDARAASDILVVDDDAANLAAIEVALGELGRGLVKASSGREALRLLLEEDFALILLDVKMPGMDGFETARMIRSRRRTRHVPIIFVTAYSRDDADILYGYSLGAVDFLFKPIVPEVLRAKASVFVELQQRTAEVARQAELLREMERRELDRHMQQERQRWEADALREESRRKDEFLAVLAHELRNPLAPMVTGLELIRQYGIGHEGLDRVRASMERQVHHLVRLVDDLLDVSRISQGKIILRCERIDLGDVMDQALDSVRPFLAERRHELSLSPCDEPLPIDGDAVRLTQVVANLLHNAARYTHPGGQIRLSCGRDRDFAVVRVADNGRGIGAAMLERIFDMFVQEQENGSGLGLGLTLVHRLVHMHGGRVRAYSEGRGKGSEFVVRLPLSSAGEAAGVAAGAEDEPHERDEPLRIVVVEDQDDVRHGVQALLEQWGHGVECAANGAEGVERILASRPDVALVDIAMPGGIDGYGVARRVRAALGAAAPRLIALTGFGRPEDQERSRDAGFAAHLTKPAAASDLQRALRSRLHDDDEPQGRPPEETREDRQAGR
ncbi:MAG TPA: response regulator [Thermoanaerobaculia bacterium]|nr:response regulator [Thermoanaerobaculia bacterium]